MAPLAAKKASETGLGGSSDWEPCPAHSNLKPIERRLEPVRVPKLLSHYARCQQRLKRLVSTAQQACAKSLVKVAARAAAAAVFRVLYSSFGYHGNSSFASLDLPCYPSFHLPCLSFDQKVDALLFQSDAQEELGDLEPFQSLKNFHQSFQKQKGINSYFIWDDNEVVHFSSLFCVCARGGGGGGEQGRERIIKYSKTGSLPFGILYKIMVVNSGIIQPSCLQNLRKG